MKVERSDYIAKSVSDTYYKFMKTHFQNKVERFIQVGNQVLVIYTILMQSTFVYICLFSMCIFVKFSVTRSISKINLFTLTLLLLVILSCLNFLEEYYYTLVYID